MGPTGRFGPSSKLVKCQIELDKAFYDSAEAVDDGDNDFVCTIDCKYVVAK